MRTEFQMQVLEEQKNVCNENGILDNAKEPFDWNPIECRNNLGFIKIVGG